MSYVRLLCLQPLGHIAFHLLSTNLLLSFVQKAASQGWTGKQAMETLWAQHLQWGGTCGAAEQQQQDLGELGGEVTVLRAEFVTKENTNCPYSQTVYF